MAEYQIRRAIGLLSNRQATEHALTELRHSGFPMKQVSAIARNAAPTDRIAGVKVTTSKYEQTKGGAQAGALTGGLTGGLIGFLGGLGLFAIPGVGTATGVALLMTSTLLSGGLGVVGGSIVGALIGLGVPAKKARHYGNRVNAGDYLIIVEGTPEEVSRAEEILNRRSVRDWSTYDGRGKRVEVTDR